jgi:tetratricopeptide (TPR) repeat protein
MKAMHALVLSLALGLSAAPSWAQTSPKEKKPAPPPMDAPTAPEADFTKAQALFERGESFYKLGEYDKALHEYREAYLVSKMPLMLINIAQCYRYMGKYDEAKTSYETYLREDPRSAYRADIESKIAEMNAILEAKRKEAAQALPASMIAAPPAETKRVKPWMWSTAGAALLGGSVLTIALLRGDDTPPPQTDIGGRFVDF